MKPTPEPSESAAAPSEPWPDPEDVRDWLASLDEGIRLLEVQLANARAHREVCRQAAETATASPGEDATRRLCLLMHGVMIEPAALDPEDIPLCERMWTPPTDEQKRERQLAAAKLKRERDLDEQRRRIAAAERITGTRYAGVDIEVPSRKRCPECGHRFAGATHSPDGKGCDVLVNVGRGVEDERCGCMTDPQAHGMTAAGAPVSEAWRADVPSGDLHRVLSGACDDDEEMQRGLREAERLGLTHRQIEAANPPNLEIGRQNTRVQEVPANPQHQDDDHGG
jgi:hypothetical protein